MLENIGSKLTQRKDARVYDDLQSWGFIGARTVWEMSPLALKKKKWAGPAWSQYSNGLDLVEFGRGPGWAVKEGQVVNT